MAEKEPTTLEKVKHQVMDKVLTTIISAVILVPVGAAGMKVWENSESSERKFGMIMSQIAAQNKKDKELEKDIEEIKKLIKDLHIDKPATDR